MTKPLRDAIAAGHPWIYDRALAPPEGFARGRRGHGRRRSRPARDRPRGSDVADPRARARPRFRRTLRWPLGRRPRRARRGAAHARSIARRLHRPPPHPRRGRWLPRARDRSVRRYRGDRLRRSRRDRVLARAPRRCPRRPRPRWRRLRARVAARRSQLRGAPPAKRCAATAPEIAIAEDDARFAVDVRAGQKTGFFLDQRDNRRTDPPPRRRALRARTCSATPAGSRSTPRSVARPA